MENKEVFSADKYAVYDKYHSLVADCIKEAVALATQCNQTLICELNGVTLAIAPNSTFEAEFAFWKKAGEVNSAVYAYKRQEYEKTDEFKAAQAEEARKAAELAKEIEAARKFPFEIAEGKEKEYADYVKLNSGDPYSHGVVVYGELWAQMMQKEMAEGKALEECAAETSHKADTDGITGFMYGAAVSALAKFWKHGEALRVWHNKQYNHEGDGVVNPAIITVNTSKDDGEVS